MRKYISKRELNVWVKANAKKRKKGRRGRSDIRRLHWKLAGDDQIYGYNENLAPTKVVCSIWHIFQLAFFLFYFYFFILYQPIYLFRPKSKLFMDIAGRPWYFSVFRAAWNSRVSVPTVQYEINSKTRTLNTIFSMFKLSST